MKRIVFVVFLFFLSCGRFAVRAQAVPQSKSATQTYTQSEYKAFLALETERDPNTRAHLVEGFIAQFPQSVLLVYVYPICYQTYFELKDYTNGMECVDKLEGLGDAATVEQRFQALYSASGVYNKMNSNDAVLAAKTRSRALDGANLIGKLKRPDGVDADLFEAEKRRAAVYLQSTAGHASLVMKDYSDAAKAFNDIIAVLEALPIHPIGTRQGPSL